mmetsp:Transcript_120450/g.257167  ORF Transcript_120450/g.257167 Transcript_120450/m.257167 type:complete len:203 (-) Transcript_120450:94-702(-)
MPETIQRTPLWSSPGVISKLLARPFHFPRSPCVLRSRHPHLCLLPKWRLQCHCWLRCRRQPQCRHRHRKRCYSTNHCPTPLWREAAVASGTCGSMLRRGRGCSSGGRVHVAEAGAPLFQCAWTVWRCTAPRSWQAAPPLGRRRASCPMAASPWWSLRSSAGPTSRAPLPWPSRASTSSMAPSSSASETNPQGSSVRSWAGSS